MASIHPHKALGWRIRYRVWFPDGNWTEKERYAKKRAKAQLIFHETSSLEDLSTTMRYLHVAPTKNPVKRIKFRD